MNSVLPLANHWHITVLGPCLAAGGEDVAKVLCSKSVMAKERGSKVLNSGRFMAWRSEKSERSFLLLEHSFKGGCHLWAGIRVVVYDLPGVLHFFKHIGAIQFVPAPRR